MIFGVRGDLERLEVISGFWVVFRAYDRLFGLGGLLRIRARRNKIIRGKR